MPQPPSGTRMSRAGPAGPGKLASLVRILWPAALQILVWIVSIVRLGAAQGIWHDISSTQRQFMFLSSPAVLSSGALDLIAISCLVLPLQEFPIGPKHRYYMVNSNSTHYWSLATKFRTRGFQRKIAISTCSTSPW